MPDPSVVVLIGAAGSGKTTFAARWFDPRDVLSSDAFRARHGRGESDQGASGRAFRALHAALVERARGGRLTVVDATNVRAAARRDLLRVASATGLPAVAIVLDLTLGECLSGDRARPGRHVDPAVIERQWEALRAAIGEPMPASPRGIAADRPPASGTDVVDCPPLIAEGFAIAVRLLGRDGVASARVRRGAPTSRTIGGVGGSELR